MRFNALTTPLLALITLASAAPTAPSDDINNPDYIWGAVRDYANNDCQTKAAWSRGERLIKGKMLRECYEFEEPAPFVEGRFKDDGCAFDIFLDKKCVERFFRLDNNMKGCWGAGIGEPAFKSYMVTCPKPLDS